MEHIADKKRAIFKSMLELVRGNGFHGTPMSLVAKQAGVAAGTIYHYFESKEELIGELFCFIRKQLIAAVEKGNCEGISYKERFFSIWMNLYLYYANNPDVLRFFEQYVNSPYNTIKKNSADEFYQMLFLFFRKGIEAGYFKSINPEILGVLAHGNIIITAKMQAYGKLAICKTELHQIAQTLWDGMLLQPLNNNKKEASIC